LLLSFGVGGVLTAPQSDYWAATVVAAGALYLGGTRQSGQTGYGWLIEKRSLTTGERIADFGTDGAVENDPSPFDDEITAMATDGSFLYLAGFFSLDGADKGWRIEKRSLMTGELDRTFGGDGFRALNPSMDYDTPRAMAVDGANLYVVGMATVAPLDEAWLIVKLDRVTGQLAPDFGNGGVVYSSLSPGVESPLGMAIDSGVLYVAGYDQTRQQDLQWRIEKRRLDTGEFVREFGEPERPGVVRADLGPGDDSAAGVVVTPDGLIVFGSDSSPGDDQWRLEFRDSISGALLDHRASNPTNGSDRPRAAIMDGGRLYVAGYDFSGENGTVRWRIEKWNRGTLDEGFGTGGVIISGPAFGGGTAVALALSPQSLFIVGTDGMGMKAGRRGRVEARAK